MNRYANRTKGNTLIFVLIIGLGLMGVISLYTATTRNNVQTAEERTVRAQMTIENHLVAPSKMRGTLTALLLEENPRTYNDCANPVVFIENDDACGKANPDPKTGSTYLPTGALPTTQADTAALSITEIPFHLLYTAQSSEDRQQQSLTSGSIIQRRDIPENFAIIANTLIIPDEARVFDGNVVVLGTASIPANKNIVFEEGFITRADSVNIGSSAVNVADFGPNIFFPCEPTSDCPRFGGVGMMQRSLKSAVPAEDAIRDLSSKASNPGFAARRIPAGTDTVFLGLSGGRTALLFCGPSDCMAVRASNVTDPENATEGTAFDVLSTRVPRPPADGTPYALPSTGWTAGAIAQGTDWTAEGTVRVRSLTPNGVAYADSMTLYTSGNFIVETSLLAAAPVCDSYPTVGDDGSVIPANCQNITQKLALGLVAAGNIYIGNSSQPLLPGQDNLTINAHLGAGDTIRVSDNRLDKNLVVGSLNAKTVDLNDLQLTEDPRLIRTRALHQGELAGSEQTVRYARGTSPVTLD